MAMNWNPKRAVFLAICAIISVECFLAAMVVYDCAFVDLDPQPNHQCSTRELRSDIMAMFSSAIAQLMAFAIANDKGDE